MIQEAIKQLVTGKSLTQEQAQAAMGDIMAGRATPVQISSFLTALRIKGETVLEIAGCALAMQQAADSLPLSAKIIVDTCGTGGDGAGSFNISTAAAFVVAGAGFTVAKHGNRSISSQSGSADILEALGVNIQAPLEIVRRCLEELGIGFLFAPQFHPAMKYAMPVRKELGLRTIFNILGPLVNPARANVQVIGVYEESLVQTIAQVLARLKNRCGYVVHDHGYDEITLTGTAFVAEIGNSGRVRLKKLGPQDFGLKRVSKAHLAGGSARENALLLENILKGGAKHPLREVVAANAALAIYAASRKLGSPAIGNLKQAAACAMESLTSGKALEKLERLKKLSHGE